MSPEEFIKFVHENSDGEYGVMAPPTDAQVGLDILVKHLLGDDWYTFSSTNVQSNTESIYEILKRYPDKSKKKNRKDKLDALRYSIHSLFK